MEFLIELECNPETKVSVKILRDQISSAKISEFNNNISEMLEHIASAIDRIIEMGETRDNLMKQPFGALLTSPNTVFHRHFQLEKMS